MTSSYAGGTNEDRPRGPTDEDFSTTGAPADADADAAAAAESAAPGELPETEDSETERRYRSTPPDLPLRIRDLRKRFGGLVALDGATFGVEAGSMTGLIGPNGAGKSTTFNCITGVHEPDGGQVFFQGEDITDLQPHEVARKGLVRTFQIARELDEMTVLENLMLAPRGQRGEALYRSITPGLRGSVVEQEEGLREAVWETLEFFEIDHLAEEYAGNLSGGQRKLLELARALMVDPTMLLLDEPFAGVNPTLEEKLLERIHALRDEGYTFLVVEHDMDLIMQNCEHVIVMHQGRVLGEGSPDEIRDNERVIEAYLGGEVE